MKAKNISRLMASIQKIQKTKSKNKSKRNRIATNYLRNLLILLFCTGIHHVFGTHQFVPNVLWDDLSIVKIKEFVPQFDNYKSSGSKDAWKTLYTKTWNGKLLTAHATTKNSIDKTKKFLKDKFGDQYEYLQVPNDGSCMFHAVAEGMLRHINNEQSMIEQLKQYIEKAIPNFNKKELKKLLPNNQSDYANENRSHVLLRYLAYFSTIHETYKKAEVYKVVLTEEYLMMDKLNDGSELILALRNLDFQVDNNKDSTIRFKFTRYIFDNENQKYILKPFEYEKEENEEENEDEKKEIILWYRGVTETKGTNHWDLLIEKKEAGDNLLKLPINSKKKNQPNKKTPEDNRKNITTNKKKKQNSKSLESNTLENEYKITTKTKALEYPTKNIITLNKDTSETTANKKEDKPVSIAGKPYELRETYSEEHLHQQIKNDFKGKYTNQKPGTTVIKKDQLIKSKKSYAPSGNIEEKNKIPINNIKVPVTDTNRNVNIKNDPIGKYTNQNPSITVIEKQPLINSKESHATSDNQINEINNKDNRKNIITNKKKEDYSGFLYFIIKLLVLCIGVFVVLYLYDKLMQEHIEDTQENSKDTSPNQSLNPSPEKTLSPPSNKTLNPLSNKPLGPYSRVPQNTTMPTQNVICASHRVSIPTPMHNISEQYHQGRDTLQNDAITIYPPKNTITPTSKLFQLPSNRISIPTPMHNIPEQCYQGRNTLQNDAITIFPPQNTITATPYNFRFTSGHMSIPTPMHNIPEQYHQGRNTLQNHAISPPRNTIMSTQNLRFTSDRLSFPTPMHNIPEEYHQGRDTLQNDAITIYQPKNTIAPIDQLTF